MIRGQEFRFFGYMPDHKTVEWIMTNGGHECFRNEVRNTFLSLPTHLAAEWVKTFDVMESLFLEIRATIYGLLEKRLDLTRMTALLEDNEELEDVFLTLFGSYVRCFFLLIPEVSDKIVAYEALETRFAVLGNELRSVACREFNLPDEGSMGKVLVLKTLELLRQS